MPRPTKETQSKNVTEVVVPTPAPTPAVVEQVPAADVPAKKRAARPKKEEQAAPVAPAVVSPPAPTAAVAVAPAVQEDVLEEEVADSKPSRVVANRESIMADFSELLNLLEQQIVLMRDNSSKTNGVRFLRTVSKRVRNLQAASARVLKQKQPSARKNNNSGFLKPVKISSEMSKFTGLDSNGLHSRVDVTKFLCNYIKEHSLNNPADKRQINADPALAKLLGYDAKTADKPLTYYHVQSLLKSHFTKNV